MLRQSFPGIFARNRLWSCLIGPPPIRVLPAGALSWTRPATQTSQRHVVLRAIPSDGCEPRGADSLPRTVLGPAHARPAKGVGIGTQHFHSCYGRKLRQMDDDNDAVASLWTDLRAHTHPVKERPGCPRKNSSFSPPTTRASLLYQTINLRRKTSGGGDSAARPSARKTQDKARREKMLAAMGSINTSPSVRYKKILNPSQVMSFEVLSAQETTDNVYPLMVRFASSSPIIKIKCGKGAPPGCFSSCNPAENLPLWCNNEDTPHRHDDYLDMVPTFFTVIPPHTAVDCGPHNEDGVQIPSSISIGTKALEELFMCDGEEFVDMDEEDRKARAELLIDTTFIAAVKKDTWGPQNRTRYRVVALSNDAKVISRLSRSTAPEKMTRPPLQP